MSNGGIANIGMTGPEGDGTERGFEPRGQALKSQKKPESRSRHRRPNVTARINRSNRADICALFAGLARIYHLKLAVIEQCIPEAERKAAINALLAERHAAFQSLKKESSGRAGSTRRANRASAIQPRRANDSCAAGRPNKQKTSNNIPARPARRSGRVRSRVPKGP